MSDDEPLNQRMLDQTFRCYDQQYKLDQKLPKVVKEMGTRIKYGIFMKKMFIEGDIRHVYLKKKAISDFYEAVSHVSDEYMIDCLFYRGLVLPNKETVDALVDILMLIPTSTTPDWEDAKTYADGASLGEGDCPTLLRIKVATKGLPVYYSGYPSLINEMVLKPGILKITNKQIVNTIDLSRSRSNPHPQAHERSSDYYLFDCDYIEIPTIEQLREIYDDELTAGRLKLYEINYHQLTEEEDDDDVVRTPINRREYAAVSIDDFDEFEL